MDAMSVLGVRRREVLLELMLVVVASMSVAAAAAEGAPWFWPPATGGEYDPGCLSWRVMVEANNAKGWRTVPPPCVGYVRTYMTWGQYARDVASVAAQIAAYADQLTPAADGAHDAWVLDVDDTCISNLLYDLANQFGAYDPAGFTAWASKGVCPAIPAMVQVFHTLKAKGFRVFIVTGRDEAALGSITAANLVAAGFAGYDRLIMRNAGYRGLSSVVFKSAMRRQLVEEGYRIRGNIGDQWSDLQGDCVGDRVFKVPNPMYFVP